MNKRWIAAVSCALLLVAARESQALWRLSDVTPAYPTVSDRTFTVNSEPAESLQKVRVTITPVGKKLLSPYLSGYVWLHDGERFLGEIAVEEQRKGESSVFSMKLEPKVARNSRFEVHESNYVWKKNQRTRPSRDEPRRELLMGGEHFRLDLGKFLAPAKPE
jgi:hypothetical protein